MNLVNKMKPLLFLLLVVISFPAFSEDSEELKLKQKLTKMFPNEVPFEVSRTPVPGLFEIDFGDSFMYITADGQYAVKGDIIDMFSNTNLTDAKRSSTRLATLSVITDENTIIYPAKKKLTTITVFTDIDCSYCRKLHSQMQGYNDLGITIKYAFYPRAGLGSSSYKKAVSVWCADDKRKALDRAKSGQFVESRDCDNPIKLHMDVANKLGITSTPTLVFEDGQIIPGYIPPDRLLSVMKQRKIIP